MLDTTTTASKSMAPPRSVRSKKRGEADSNPPVLTPLTKPDLHPIYGSLPIGRDGFALDRQLIQMLDIWHQRAVEICQAFEKVADNAGRDEFEKFEEVVAIKEDIYWAAIKAEVRRPSEIALQLQIIVRDASLGTDDSCEFLSVKELSVIAANLLEATKPLVPKKRVGTLRRGRKLTVAGLHVRYGHSRPRPAQDRAWRPVRCDGVSPLPARAGGRARGSAHRPLRHGRERRSRSLPRLLRDVSGRRRCCRRSQRGLERPSPAWRRHRGARFRRLDRRHHRPHAEVRHGRYQARLHRREC
ncbi:MAG: hypothetical protein JWR80_4822 [Bradyrhizobium sp.]|nr:hypothetical protein [Bradyrhizobium sp.]